MALVDLWQNDRVQIIDKRMEQLIAFAGDGKLRDGNRTSEELRSLLSVVPSEVIGNWIEDCLDQRFTDFGLVLQDIVNEIGRRLGFEVRHGVYRGHTNEGLDGLWRIPNGRAILIESKSSTSYAINLTRIASYRKQVAPELGLSPEEISILLVVGTEDTEELESQVRGSRFAWDIRLLGMKSLFRLVRLKESLDDPAVERQIQEILIPQEFTRLDRIVNLVFATAEDAQEVVDETPVELVPAFNDTTDGIRPANFHSLILPKLEKQFGGTLIKRSRVQWATADDSVLVSCQVSKKFDRTDLTYWFGLKRATKEALAAHKNAYCAFGLGSSDKVVLVPFLTLQKLLPCMYTSPEPDGNVRHWHIRFWEESGQILLLCEPKSANIDVAKYLI